MAPQDDIPEWVRVHPRELLARHGHRPVHRLGQNFLVPLPTLQRIVESADLGTEDVVLEIGTGMGRMAALLAKRAGQVVTVEVDERLHAFAAEHLAANGNVRLLCCDFLESKHSINPVVTEAIREHLGSAQGLTVVSNLPYSISSPAIVNLLEWEVRVDRMALMLQKEVAERLTARPGTKEYGPLTVYVAWWAEVEQLFTIAPGAFWPPPEVTSAGVRIVRRPGRVGGADYDAFAETVRRVFTNRRKTVRAAARLVWGKVPDIGTTLAEAGVDPARRVDRLTPDDFSRLADALGKPA